MLLIFFQSDTREPRERDRPSSKENRVPIRSGPSNGSWDSVRVKDEPGDPSEPPRERSRDSRVDPSEMPPRERTRELPLPVDPSESPARREIRVESRGRQDRNAGTSSLNPEPPITSSPLGRRKSPPRLRNPSPVGRTSSPRDGHRDDEPMEVDLSMVKKEPEDKGYERQVRYQLFAQGW